MGGFLSGVRNRLTKEGFKGNDLDRIMLSVSGHRNGHVAIPKKVVSRLRKLLQSENTIVIVRGKKGLLLYPFQTYQDMKVRGIKLNQVSPELINPEPINPKANLGCRYQNSGKHLHWKESELQSLPVVFKQYLDGTISKSKLREEYQGRSISSIKMAMQRHILHTVK